MKRFLVAFAFLYTCACLIGVHHARSQSIMTPIMSSGGNSLCTTNLVAHYNANSLGANGSLVASWTDSVGGFNATQSTGTAKPLVNTATYTGFKALQTYGNGSVAYNGQGLTTLTIPAGLALSSQSMSVIVVMELTTADGVNSPGPIVFGSSQAYLFYNPAIGEGTPNHNSTQYLPMRPQMFGFASSGTAVTTFINNVFSSSLGTITSASMTGGTIGKSSTNTMTGNIYEIAVYSNTISQGCLNQDYGYAESTYGVRPINTTKVLFVTGDSLSSQAVAVNYGGNGWVQQWLQNNPALDAINYALSGATTSQWNSPAGALGAITATSKSCTYWMGTNDNAAGTSSTWIAASLANVATSVTAMRSAGCTNITTFDMLPRTGGVTNAGFETARGTWNTSLAANPMTMYGDHICQVSTDMLIGQAGDEASTTYYQANPVGGGVTDGIHLNQLGNTEMLYGSVGGGSFPGCASYF